MRRERILLFLGIWVAILPYLGFPYFWKNILFTLSGFILVYHSYVLLKKLKPEEKNTETFENFNNENNLEHEYDNRENVRSEEGVRFN